MISQADIIRSLVNKNCTDEAIMSTALSPDCTLPKLLQKFTEAERFDLALDVYMKLGMDVAPLWKTWALRCLKNRDFQAAREKFRHCFQRFRSSAGRFGSATNSLLEDILRELTRMKETKLALSEEVELVKNSKNKSGQKPVHLSRRDSTNPVHQVKINETKPKIFNECMYYLKEYGTTELLIKFYLENELWKEAIATLSESQDGARDDEFFISHVITPSEANGHFDLVISELLKLGLHINSTSRYFKVLYQHLAKRHNTLYYVQHTIGDHIKAAENQVRNFFLKKPCPDYKELNQRLPSLLSAREEYSEHLKRLGSSQSERDQSEFITQLSREETESRLKTIDTQIEVTRNFQINEVPGCINEVVVCTQAAACQAELNDDNMPVTLFDECPRRRTFLAALILIYFDIDCTNSMSNSGFQLASRLINESDLDKLSVFKTAMNIIIDDESSDLIENATLLLKRLREDYIACTQRAKLKPSVGGGAGNTTRRASSVSTSVGANTDNLSKNVISRPRESEKIVVVSRARGQQQQQQQQPPPKSPTPSSTSTTNRTKKKVYNFEPPDRSVRPGTDEAARLLCDEVIRDSIRSCLEEDYKMELIKLLSPEAKVVLYIELGKLSVAQRLAFDIKRPDYVKMVLREAEKLNQDHVKDVCQHWLAKH